MEYIKPIQNKETQDEVRCHHHNMNIFCIYQTNTKKQQNVAQIKKQAQISEYLILEFRDLFHVRSRDLTI